MEPPKTCPKCGTGVLKETPLNDHWFTRYDCEDCEWWDIVYKHEEYRTW